jgi:hypothetical protein
MAVAGPGQYATRVDGTAFDKNATKQPIREMASQSYGDRADLTGIQGSAPMSATPSVTMPGLLSEPSRNPNRPVTAGTSMPGGPGPEVLPIPPIAQDEVAQTIRSLAAIYPDPDLLRLVQRLETEGR